MGRFTDDLRAEVSSYQKLEWHGTVNNKPISLFALPLTQRDMGMMQAKLAGSTVDTPAKIQVDVIIEKALDENGDKAFDAGDRPLLLSMTYSTISDIYETLFSSSVTPEGKEEFEERKKN